MRQKRTARRIAHRSRVTRRRKRSVRQKRTARRVAHRSRVTRRRKGSVGQQLVREAIRSGSRQNDESNYGADCNTETDRTSIFYHQSP
jgi:hypothetical protein